MASDESNQSWSIVTSARLTPQCDLTNTLAAATEAGTLPKPKNRPTTVQWGRDMKRSVGVLVLADNPVLTAERSGIDYDGLIQQEANSTGYGQDVSPPTTLFDSDVAGAFNRGEIYLFLVPDRQIDDGSVFLIVEASAATDILISNDS